MESITWKIGGEAGFGIMSAGTMFARTFTRRGYYAFASNEYPSLIRGGHNAVTVRIATQKFEALNRDVHILLALNNETVDIHKDELADGSIIVFDPNDHEWQASDFQKKITLLPIGLTAIIKEHSGEPVMRNTVALGASVALVGADFDLLRAVITDQFKRKGQEIIDHNLRIAKAGYDYVKANYSSETSKYLSPPRGSDPLLVINGSEALGLGAVRAGMKFAASYPMTPINSVITFLAEHAEEFGIVYKQPEDEIAGINMAIGAAIAGVRSMTATSGGGFALMVEGLSLAGITEVPLVIDLGMRVGPATGMPTWTEQGELLFVIRAGHGEFPRIVLTPGDTAEIYTLTLDAFNLADRYQVPVFILTDKYMNESQWSLPVSHFKGDVLIDRGKLLTRDALVNQAEFKRYDLSSEDGVSPRSVPGMKNGFYYANSYEHDEWGHVTEDADKRIAMAGKRLKKFHAIQKDVRAPTVYGNEQAEITFVGWGSTKGPILEAMKLLDERGIKTNFIHYTWMYPFPAEESVKLFGGAKRIIDIEQNATSQLAMLIREETGVEIKERMVKFNGRPYFPEEIVEKVKSP